MDYESRVKEANKTLTGIYQPQMDIYNKRLSTLSSEYDPLRVQADQARVNSFRQIENAANSKGMFFSGQPIQNQMEYNYGTYEPALANINIKQNEAKNSLEEALTQLGINIDLQSRKTVDSQLEAEEAARQKEIERQISERRHQESLAASRASTAATLSAKEMAKYKVTDKASGGKAFTYNGKPISLKQYVEGVGGDANDVLDFLRWSNTSYGKNIYNQVKNIQDPAGLINTIRMLDTNNYLGFGSDASSGYVSGGSAPAGLTKLSSGSSGLVRR